MPFGTANYVIDKIYVLDYCIFHFGIINDFLASKATLMASVIYLDYHIIHFGIKINGAYLKLLNLLFEFLLFFYFFANLSASATISFSDMFPFSSVISYKCRAFETSLFEMLFLK